MAYTINKTDGSILTTVADGQIDQFSTSITLIGKNYSGFGEVLNENFIKVLENFADTSQPDFPITGQIWFDSSELKLKVYNGSAFVPVSSATISTTQPLTLGVGDLWFDDLNKQLFFYDGTNTILLGPDYSVSQGISGLKVQNILDTLNQNRVITLLYTNGVLLGIFSKDSFTPKIAIDGFTGDIQPGFNAGSLSGIKFNVTVTNSEKLGNQPASSYVRNDTSNIINGQLILASNLGLIVGDANQAQLIVSNGNVLLANIASNKDLNLIVRRGVVAETAVNIVSADRKIKLYDGFLNSEIIAGGNLTVKGNLSVEGDVTTVNTSVLTIEDKNIVLATLGDSTAGSDEYADGGGMILRGTQASITMNGSSISGFQLNVGTASGTVLQGMRLTGTGILPGTYIEANVSGGSGTGSIWTVSKSQTVGPITITGIKGDHEFTWDNGGDTWYSTEHISLAAGRAFKIGGVTVIDGNSLGTGITSIPGVTSFGTQTVINVGPDLGSGTPTPYVRIQNNRISTLSGTGQPANLDLELSPTSGGDVVLFNLPKIQGLFTTGQSGVNQSTESSSVLTSTELSEATNKEYVTNFVRTRSIVLSMDISDGISNSGIAALLTQIAPPAEFENGTFARILCSFLSASSTSFDINALVQTTTATFVTPGPGSAPAVIEPVAFLPATIPAPIITPTRVVKTFQLVTGAWTFVS